jgi:hypothetical protein
MKHPPSAPDLDDRIREEGLWKESLASWHHEMEMVNVPKQLLPKATKNKLGGGARAGTLVVCPLIALYQVSHVKSSSCPTSVSSVSSRYLTLHRICRLERTVEGRD